MTDMTEIEDRRLLKLARVGKFADPARYAPGSFGCHEALHVSSMIGDMVARHLLEHPAIVLDAELYQAIGARHLAVDEK